MSSKVNIRISCAIFTLDEAINLPKCLKSLEWCDDVVVIDSYSKDDTEALCKSAGVRFFQHPFSGFGDQRNWAFDNIDFKHEWIFVLDADEEITPELFEELKIVMTTLKPEVSAFRVKRKFYMWGRWLKHSSLYPSWVIRLIKKGKVRYVNRGHAETQVVDGRIEALEEDLKDENLKGLHAWFARQNDYSTKEAQHELAQIHPSWSALFSRNPLERRAYLKSISARLYLRPVVFFFYTYFWRKGFLDGLAGFYFSLMKAVYVGMIQLKKYEMGRRSTPSIAPAGTTKSSERRTS